jgi:hypothetical protein
MPPMQAQSFAAPIGLRSVVLRSVLGILVCGLGGCATVLQQPVAIATPAATAASTGLHPDSTAPTPTASTTLPASTVLRIGIEHLAPEPGQGEPAAPRVESLTAGRLAARPGAVPQPRTVAERSLLELADLDLDDFDDPLARHTMQFLDDLVAADRRRVRREVGLPFFGWQGQHEDRGLLLHGEERQQIDQAEWLQENGMTLLRRPVRQLLRRLPGVEQIEFEFADFRSDNVPLSEPYRVAHGDRRRLGRLSLRLHAGDLQDPVELVWIHSLVRIGTSQQAGKLSFDWALSPHLQLALRSRTEYETGDFGLRADLTYRASDFTSLHLAVGDDMDFLSTSSLYSLFETPMDGAPGLVLYAVHIF